MGLQLDCPLCCSETFSCHNSLKYHLLSVIDNLLCPACQKRFDNVYELAMHLGQDCTEETLNLPGASGNSSSDLKQGDTISTEPSTEFITCENLEEDIEYVAASNTEDVCEVDSFIEVSNEDQYYCSTCNIHFVSIEEHVQEFHCGEEIVLATDGDEEQLGVLSLGTTETAEVNEEENTANSNVSMKSARLLDTIQEEDCIDKDGRIYIRKVVKIEKFWNDTEVHTSNTNVTKLPFAINQNGLLQKLEPVSENDRVVEIYECAKCEMKFLAVNQYYKHKCCGSYKTCNLCNAHFINIKFLKAHMRMQHKKKVLNFIKEPKASFKCEVCNTLFTSSKSLRLHRRMHEPVKSKDIEPPVTYGKEGDNLKQVEGPRTMFLCQICNKSYDKQYEEAHNQFHNKEAGFNCEICNRKFYTKENLKMHMKAHIEVKKFLCRNCKKAFLTEEKLKEHKPSDCEKRQYECQYCGRRFARPHEKVKHERIHTGEKPHICAICGKAFRVSYCLTLHMRTHSGTRPYHCEYCGKRFKAHSVFSHHLLTHSNDRKYKCTFCPKMFKTGVQLAGHKNSHIKPFSCTECNRPFASLYAVRAHMETHQRQNNLKHNCWLCGASYARAFALRDHFKEQHVGALLIDQDTQGVVESSQELLATDSPNPDIIKMNVDDIDDA